MNLCKTVLPIILISLVTSMSWALSRTISSQSACVNRFSPSRVIVSSVMRQKSRVGNEVGTYGRIRKRSTFAREFWCFVCRIYWRENHHIKDNLSLQLPLGRPCVWQPSRRCLRNGWQWWGTPKSQRGNGSWSRCMVHRLTELPFRQSAWESQICL